jgi:hypothetical protein
MRPELQSVLNGVRLMSADQVPELLSELELIRATAEYRMLAPAPANAPTDQQLDIREAAERMGVGKDYLYTHAAQLPFAYRQGRNWRFSANGIADHIRKKTGNAVLTARRQ